MEVILLQSRAEGDNHLHGHLFWCSPRYGWLMTSFSSNMSGQKNKILFGVFLKLNKMLSGSDSCRSEERDLIWE